MYLEPLENAMIAELALPKCNSVSNNLRLLQQSSPALRKALLIAMNKFSELQRRFREGEVTRKEANNEIRTEISDGIRAANKPKTGEEPVERNNDLDPEVRFERHELDRFKGTRDSLVSELGKHGTAMSYAPVFPHCKPYLLVEKLKEFGIDYSKFEGHTILDSQLVVGITNEEFTKKLAAYNNLNEGFIRIVAQGKQAYKVQKDEDRYAAAVQDLRSMTLGVLAQMTKVPELKALENMLLSAKINTLKPKTYAVVVSIVHKVCTVLKELLDYLPSKVTAETIYDAMVKTASAATGKKLIAVGRPSLLLGASWLWLATANEINQITKCALGGHCAIIKWGLAFQS